MRPTDDLTCVFAPLKYLKGVLPLLRDLAEPQARTQSSGMSYGTALELECRWLSDIRRDLSYASIGAADDPDPRVHRKFAEAQELLTRAEARWLRECRSPEGRRAVLYTLTGDPARAELDTSTLWVLSAHPTPGHLGRLFRTAFTANRLLHSRTPQFQVLTVPEWLPTLKAAARVLDTTTDDTLGGHPNVNLAFPHVTPEVADTFAALWCPRDKDSVYYSAETAFAAAQRLGPTTQAMA